MKKVKIITFAAFLVLSGLISTAFIMMMPSGNKTLAVNKNEKGFAVIELFTSEGCSSCPSADAVIAKIEKESIDKPVYILAYHVDYWNRLGWKDAFSSATYSARQSKYANWLNLSSVYTPQVVVNGKTEFVGSQEGTLRNAIRTNLQKAAKGDLSLTNLRTADGHISLQYHTDAAAANNNLLLALVQKNATTIVKAGENDGRTLSHVQIVSNIQNIPLSNKTGNASILLPNNFSAQKYEVIAFVQNARTGEITAATRSAFPVNNTIASN